MPWPYGCSSSAGCSASRTVKNASADASRSSALSTPSPEQRDRPERQPEADLQRPSAARSTRATDRRAARDVRLREPAPGGGDHGHRRQDTARGRRPSLRSTPARPAPRAPAPAATASSRMTVCATIGAHPARLDAPASAGIRLVDHQRVDEPAVHLGHAGDIDGVPQPRHHLARGRLQRSPADDRADGDRAAPATPRSPRGRPAPPGSADARRSDCSAR